MGNGHDINRKKPEIPGKTTPRHSQDGKCKTVEQRTTPLKKQCEESRRKKREEMRKSRRKLKEKKLIQPYPISGWMMERRLLESRKQGSYPEVHRTTATSTVKKAVLRTQYWRLRPKLKSPTPNPLNDRKAFSSYNQREEQFEK